MGALWGLQRHCVWHGNKRAPGHLCSAGSIPGWEPAMLLHGTYWERGRARGRARSITSHNSSTAKLLTTPLPATEDQGLRH